MELTLFAAGRLPIGRPVRCALLLMIAALTSAEPYGSDAWASGGPEEQQYLKLLDAELAGGSRERSSRYLRTLSPERRKSIGKSLVTEHDPRKRSVGILVLAELKSEMDAVPAVAALVADGHDQLLTSVGFVLTHRGHDAAVVRLYVESGRYLLDRLGSFTGTARARVEKYLMDGGAARPLAVFSESDARDRLSRLERQLNPAFR